jgi:Lrp/AsnC family leucine-responsive transcriptional regulator
VSAAEFEAAAQVIPGVMELILLTGSFDYMVRVACRDQTQLMEIIEQLRARAGADNTLSRIILKTSSVHADLP